MSDINERAEEIRKQLAKEAELAAQHAASQASSSALRAAKEHEDAIALKRFNAEVVNSITSLCASFYDYAKANHVQYSPSYRVSGIWRRGWLLDAYWVTSTWGDSDSYSGVQWSSVGHELWVLRSGAIWTGNKGPTTKVPFDTEGSFAKIGGFSTDRIMVRIAQFVAVCGVPWPE